MKIVLVSAPLEAADRLARTLVDEHLAACVSILPPMTSVFRWEGKLGKIEESLLVAKTGDAAVARLIARVAELHPYSLPEIVAVDVARAHAPYAKWVDEETSDTAH